MKKLIFLTSFIVSNFLYSFEHGNGQNNAAGRVILNFFGAINQIMNEPENQAGQPELDFAQQPRHKIKSQR